MLHLTPLLLTLAGELVPLDALQPLGGALVH